MSLSNQHFAEILKGNGITLIPKLHLTQLSSLFIKKGIEIAPNADDEFCTRAKFLREAYERNQTHIHLDHIWQKGALTGSVLLYIRPNGAHYRLHYYSAKEFKPYFNIDGDLIQVDVRGEYLHGDERIKTLMRINVDTITRWEGGSGIDVDQKGMEIKNPYGFLPCVLINNKSNGIGKLGLPEFDQLENSIAEHDWLINQLHANLGLFGSPIVVTSRSAIELREANVLITPSVAESGGYYRGTGYANRDRERIKLRSIIDNFEPGETFAFTTPEPIDQESQALIHDYARQIRVALGSVDERTLTSATATLRQPEELTVALAFAIATASKKATTYFTYGIAIAYSLMLQMAEMDLILPTLSRDKLITWRYLGDIWKRSSRDVLNDSIVGRNLLRLGVNVKETLRTIYPEKNDAELDDLLRGGFAYEFINGISQVAAILKTAQKEDNSYAFDVEEYLKEVLDGRPEPERDYGNEGGGFELVSKPVN